ncbi:hypothetical protein E8E13_008080 [Curvularia kusanoi]|uniref:AB hydrolase-1 domain-containing protein n=1 Tax=Curvularia kusanoi TaxID=90978 RepID=A0A9P4TEV8_CURKU|nr:hypothetical protein E8E13_008080 [Curvularia kusanoi]
MAEPLVLPRPGKPYASQPPIPAPSEAAFTATFGTLLPAAQYLSTNHGRAAYYQFPAQTSGSPSTDSPSSPSSSDHVPKRVLLIHGVQTPALGLVPLVKALRARFPLTSFALVDLWGHGLSETPVAPHEGSLFHGLVDGVLGVLGWKGEEGVGIVGFSFGAVVSMGYLSSPLYRQWAQGGEGVRCCVLVAPAGLLRKEWFKPEEWTLLSQACSPEDEGKAAKFVVSALEGGELVVPGDWKDIVAGGSVCAQAVKQWQLDNHKGHEASVVGIFRDGEVLENDALFVKMRETGMRSLMVLGSEDGLSSEEEVRAFGFDVKVVQGAGHGVVRENAEEVAEYIAEFWRAE